MKQKALMLGLGKRGEKCWLKIMLERQDVDITGIVVPRVEREMELKEQYPVLEGVAWFRSLEDALGEIDVDFCVVTTPPQVHFEQIKNLLESGIDVLTEKPLVMAFDHGLQLAQLAKKHHRELWIGQNFRYCQSSQYLYSLVKNHKFGSPEMANIQYLRNRDGKADWLNKYPLTMEQPMLFEQSEHHFDLIRYCYQREVGKLYGVTMNPSWSMYANQATVSNIFEMDDGLVLNYFGTWSASHGYFDFQWRTDFQRGVMIQKSLFGDVYIGEPDEENLTRIDLMEEELFISDTRILLEHFVDREKRKSAQGIPDIFDNLKTMALVFATLEADNTGKSIYMDDYMKKTGIWDLLRRE